MRNITRKVNTDCKLTIKELEILYNIVKVIKFSL